ncbi:MAG: two component transcriptional regulator, LuxR family [Solirubrobacterales bacterium]|nr:two component transcriptional regulator, LuxR family [Solirubrobacterales bacterium]
MTTATVVSQEQPEYGLNKVRVLVFHAEEVTRWGYRVLVSREAWSERCVCADGPEQLLMYAARYDPHVVVLSASAGATVLPLAAQVQRVAPLARVLLLADDDDVSQGMAVAAGAVGCVSPGWPAAQVMDAIHAAASQAWVAPVRAASTAVTLSRRERQVLRELATGATNKEIASRLFLSPETIKHHMSRAFRKVGARNRVEALTRARLLGVLPD